MAVKRRAPTQASGSKNEPYREGEWNCAKCSAKNYSARISCYKCSLSKRESELQTKGKAALDWECFKCKANNFSFRDSCFKCSISRFESDDIRAQREGIPWVCRFCEIENRVTNINCFKCKRPKDIADVIPPRRCYSPRRSMMGPGDHGPRDHGPRDHGPRDHGPRDHGPRRSFSPPPMRYSFPVGQKLLPDPPSRPVSPLNKTPFLNRPLSPLPGTRSSDWQCLLCCTHNDHVRNDCYKCTTIRGENAPRPSGPSQSQMEKSNIKGPGNSKEGKWRCPACNFSNFKFRTECKECKEKKPEDIGLSITINNDSSNPTNTCLLNHSMTKDDEPSPVKRRRMDYGDEGPSSSSRQKWGTDWICGYCRVDVFPTRLDCFKCGRHRDVCELRDAGRRDMAPRDMGHRDMAPRDMGHRDLGPRDMGPRFDRRDRFSPDPRDRFGPDSRGRFGPDPRDRFSGPLDGFTCRCGNFNKMCESACVKCGRPNDIAMRRDDIVMRRDGHQMWHSATQPRGRFSPERGGRRSPPRFHNEGPRRNIKVALAKKAAAKSKKETVTKEEPKKAKKADWICKECPGPVLNYNGRTKCFKCKKNRSEVVDKNAAVPQRDDSVVGKDFGEKSLVEVFEDYVALNKECEENKDKKFAEGEVDLRNIFKIKRIAFRRLEKAQKKEDVGETEKYQNLFDTMTKLHSKAHTDLNADDGWLCLAGDCDAFNFSKRTACYKCLKDKPVVGKTPDDDGENGDENPSLEKEVEDSEVTNSTTEDGNKVGEEAAIDDTIDTVKEATSDDVEISEPPVDFETDY